MKAYVVQTDYAELSSVLVYALSAGQAKKHGFGYVDCDEFINLRVRRVPEGDEWANESHIPRIEHSTSRLRDLGWRSEDGDTCMCCDLNDMGYAEDPDWVVCPWCEHCARCGHDEDCQTQQGSTRLNTNL